MYIVYKIFCLFYHKLSWFVIKVFAHTTCWIWLLIQPLCIYEWQILPRPWWQTAYLGYSIIGQLLRIWFYLNHWLESTLAENVVVICLKTSHEFLTWWEIGWIWKLWWPRLPTFQIHKAIFSVNTQQILCVVMYHSCLGFIIKKRSPKVTWLATDRL